MGRQGFMPEALVETASQPAYHALTQDGRFLIVKASSLSV